MACWWRTRLGEPEQSPAPRAVDLLSITQFWRGVTAVGVFPAGGPARHAGGGGAGRAGAARETWETNLALPVDSPQVDLHGMLVEEALAELEQHVECLGGIAYRAPEGIALSVITGRQLRTPRRLTSESTSTCCWRCGARCIWTLHASRCNLAAGWSALHQHWAALHPASPDTHAEHAPPCLPVLHTRQGQPQRGRPPPYPPRSGALAHGGGPPLRRHCRHRGHHRPGDAA
jgi:hypothetical protein